MARRKQSLPESIERLIPGLKSPAMSDALLVIGSVRRKIPLERNFFCPDLKPGLEHDGILVLSSHSYLKPRRTIRV